MQAFYKDSEWTLHGFCNVGAARRVLEWFCIAIVVLQGSVWLRAGLPTFRM